MPCHHPGIMSLYLPKQAYGVAPMKKIILSTIAALVATGSVFASYGTAAAQDYPYRPRYDRGYDRGGPPPPPYREHRRHNDGAAIAGGLAAGVIGGLIGGAIANNNGPRYYEPPPPPPPRCWFEDRRVPNSYDGGWHTESMRVCN